MTNVGFGDRDFTFAVYIGNKPNMSEYQNLSSVESLSLGEIEMINRSCGNGWRKVFNVYAKILYNLNNQYFEYSKSALTWQAYRDGCLLQNKSKTALLFSPPYLEPGYLGENDLKLKKSVVHIICGKGHAKTLISKGVLVANLTWLDDEFAIDKANNLIVCPYFDYRQLSNIKIERLSELLFSLKQDN